MSRQTFPVFVDQPGCTQSNFAITGANVSPVAPSTAGLDGRGQFLCTIFKAANVVTITWNVTFGDVPYVFIQPAAGQNNTIIEIISNTASQLQFRTVLATTNAGTNDANLMVHVDGYNTTSYVS